MQFKLPLFESAKEWGVFLSAIAFIFLLNLLFAYQGFQDFKQERTARIQGQVVNQYSKTSRHGRSYEVLRIKSDSGQTLYTTSYESIKNLKLRHVELSVVTKGVDFISYLRGFYAPGFRIKLLPRKQSRYDDLADWIASQHTHPQIKELFQALFLAIPPSRELRESFNFLGISHLIAISGFHLGVLSSIIFGILYLPYRFFQQRFFPYRHRLQDLMLITMGFLLIYLVALDFVPSVLRAFGMMVVGFILFWSNIRILSFQMLLVSVLCLIALFPHLLLSVGFWFSVSGVFYIYLYLHYFQQAPKWKVAVGLNVYVFLAMMPIVHQFFSLFSLHQLISPILTLVFTLFYPLEIALHLIGEGGFLDGIILWLMALEGDRTELVMPLEGYLVFVALSLGAVFSRWGFYGTVVFSGGFMLLGVYRLEYFP